MAAKPKTNAELLSYISENYPDVYALLNVNREVRDVLLRAARLEYTPAKLRSALAATSWWKKTSATAREWDASYALDKATGDQLLAQTRGELAAQAQRLGVTLSPADVAKMALNVRRLGWTQQQVAEALAGRFRQRSATPGLGTVTVDTLRALAKDYGVNVSDNEVTVWTQRILSGRADEAAWRSSLVARAKNLYSSIADNIDLEVSVRDYFDPYAQRAAQVLGLNPDEVDFTDPRWQRAIAVPTEGGKRVPMDFSQWEMELKTNPLYGYDRTVNGKREAAAFGAELARAVGWR